MEGVSYVVGSYDYHGASNHCDSTNSFVFDNNEAL
jgi:hypothetical protein